MNRRTTVLPALAFFAASFCAAQSQPAVIRCRSGTHGKLKSRCPAPNPARRIAPDLGRGSVLVAAISQFSGQSRHVPSQCLPEDPVVDAVIDVGDEDAISPISSQGTLGIDARTLSGNLLAASPIRLMTASPASLRSRSSFQASRPRATISAAAAAVSSRSATVLSMPRRSFASLTALTRQL